MLSGVSAKVTAQRPSGRVFPDTAASATGQLVTTQALTLQKKELGAPRVYWTQDPGGRWRVGWGEGCWTSRGPHGTSSYVAVLAAHGQRRAQGARHWGAV